MTCIIAYKDSNNNTIYMCGDKCGSNGNTQDICVEPKVFHNGDFMIGYTTSFYMGQLLKHIWNPPTRLENETTDSYLHNSVRKSLINMFKENNFGSHDGGYEIGTFILVYKSRIFTVHSDMQFFENKYLTAVGCGDVAARAAVETYIKCGFTDVESMLKSSIETVSKICCGVSKECDIVDNKQHK